MATKRHRGSTWEFVIKRAGLLPKPLYANFRNEQEGDLWARRVEAMLDRGVVPTEHVVEPKILTIGDLIDQYTSGAPVKQKAREVLTSISNKIGDTPVSDITANWVDNWIAEQKRTGHAAPATIRAKVSALGAACDWAIRKEIIDMPGRPLRGLPRGYASYADNDCLLPTLPLSPLPSFVAGPIQQVHRAPRHHSSPSSSTSASTSSCMSVGACFTVRATFDILDSFTRCMMLDTFGIEIGVSGF